MLFMYYYYVCLWNEEKKNVCNKINRVSLFYYNKGINVLIFGFKI